MCPILVNVNLAFLPTLNPAGSDEDGSGECAAGVFCMGGHTHASASSTFLTSIIKDPLGNLKLLILGVSSLICLEMTYTHNFHHTFLLH